MASLRGWLEAALAGGALLAATGLPAAADHMFPHQHVVITPGGGEVDVGPAACERGPGRRAGEFHLNVGVRHMSRGAFAHDHIAVAGEGLECPSPPADEAAD